MLVLSGNKTKEAEDKESAEQTAKATKIESSATDSPGHEAPSDESAHCVETVLTKGEVIRDVASQARLLEKVRGIIGEGVACKVLGDEQHADNLGTPEVDSLETIEVGYTRRHVLLELVGVPHHVDGFISVKGGVSLWGRESKKRSLGVFVSTLSYEPPGGLRGEKD